jgi:hypothetical protein
MQWVGVRRALGAPRRLSRFSDVLAVAVLAAGVAGCSSQSATRLASLDPSTRVGATVAFESIDGPPPEVFRKLVTSLNGEASARNIAVVSRNSSANYRIRGYVSALVARDKTSFSWVWDVYDADKHRALRVAGEEPAIATGRRRDAWSAADEEVLHRIARDGMGRIATFLNRPEAAPTEAPAPFPVTLAASRDDSPEAAGIFRLIGNGDQPAANPPPLAADEAPPPSPPPPQKRKAKRPAPATTGSSRSADAAARDRAR